MNEAICCVCFGDYDDSSCIPVVASCGHTVCKNCSTSLKRSSPSHVYCPTCRAVVNYPLATNFSYISLLSSMRSSSTGRHKNSTSSVIQFSVEEIQKSLKSNSTFLSELLLPPPHLTSPHLLISSHLTPLHSFP